MGFGENLISLRTNHGINRKELAEKLDIPYTTLRNYETNQREPGHKLLIQLAQMFSVSVDSLIGANTTPIKEFTHDLPEDALRIAEAYTKLTEHGKGAVRAIIAYESEAISAREPKQEPQKVVKLPRTKRTRDGIVEIRVYEQPAAAGLGNYLEDSAYHIEQYPVSIIPPDTDFGIMISGDSMEPEIQNGSTAFVHACLSVDSGRIGIFVLNGEAFCKKLEVDQENRQVRLVSINKKYDDIVLSESDEFVTVGVVLGHWTPQKFD